ncbi:hypothetical protein P43SY_009213 [Pythium insidiosum]|uniref:Bromo domain-containing protein n=1 Tax=Pythium insidiosum TaxID=114742 RepID=A0AAD5Q3Q8_PYTIN|nr:hypothetical protein P43SY_009213 [Pythium insidiosum]
MDELLQRKCGRLHERLVGHELSWPFLSPVDPVAMNLPTYFDVVRTPMDLSTMASKLATHQYASPEDYRADLVLMCENAIEFNKDDDHEDSVCGMAKRMLRFGLSEWEKEFSETPKASRDGASPVVSPSAKAAKSSMFDLTIDRNFEFDGGSGFGVTLPSNRPLPATAIAIAAPVGSPTDAHRFTFTNPDDVESEHFTMSADGLVHMAPSQPSEFIALSEWMRQSSMFNVLTSLRFFKHYLIYKAFSQWSSNVLFKLYCRQRKALKTRLYLAKETFCQPLLQIKRVMSQEVLSVVLLDLRAQKTYESSAFVEYQATKRGEGSKQFETCIEKLQGIIQKVCVDVKNLTKAPDPHDDFLSDAPFGNGSGSGQEKTKSIVAVKSEQQQRRKLFKRAAEEAAMISDLIRLVDYITVESLVILAVQSCREFLLELNKQIRRDLVVKISNDYADAAEYVKIFDNVRPIYEYDKVWDFDEYAQRSHTYDKVWDFDEYAQRSHTVTTLKADMLQISTWEKELEKMRAGQTIGILHVESRKLKQTLIPMTTAKLDAMKGLVKDLARAKCKNQLIEYKQRIQALLQRPQHLKEFAAHVERVQALKSKQKALVKNTNVVDELYRLLGNYGVRISSEDMVQLDDLRSVQDSYREETEAVDAFIQSRLGEMTQQLDSNIQRLDEQFEDPSHVKSELEAVKQRLSQLDELSRQYTEYQTLFNQTPFKYLNLQATQEYFGTVESLWVAVERWNMTYRNAMTNPFVEVNAEELSKEVAVAYKDANDVTSIFKDRAADFKLKMPVILELGNPAMKDRHWEKIFKALRQPWYPGILFTLENLIAFEALEMKDLIGEVSATASGEAQIEASLQKIKQGWDQMQFSCLSHRDQKDVFILGSLEEILTLLEDNQVTLQTMMGSRFILGVKDEVDRWNKRLSMLSETLDEWIQCQRSWMYLETIFCAEDIQKQLPVEAQKFALVDKNWKNVMLRTSIDPSVIRSVDSGSEILDQFKMSNKILEEIQKSLEDYLETKRMAFPRFYFLSNDELLEILSQTRDPRAVQPHLGKCFDAMKSIRFEEGSGAPIGGSGKTTPFLINAMLWLHEEARVFRDRLIDGDDRAWFNKACAELLLEHCKVSWAPERFESLLYGDYLTRENRTYRPVDDLHKLNGLLIEYLEEYNITFPSQMHLVFFHDAMHHISRICRVLRQPRGNALLVGVGGSGRQSLTRLAAFMADYKTFSIEITHRA